MLKFLHQIKQRPKMVKISTRPAPHIVWSKQDKKNALQISKYGPKQDKKNALQISKYTLVLHPNPSIRAIGWVELFMPRRNLLS